MKIPMIRAAELAAERPVGWINDEHFPASLAAFVIQKYSEPGDRVLDPFAGSVHQPWPWPSVSWLGGR